MVELRKYHADDAVALRQVFQSAILGSRRHYTATQREDWAAIHRWDAAKWQARMDGLRPWVAVGGDGQALGYADVQPNGLIDHFFVRSNAERRGVGKALMTQVLADAKALGLAEAHSEVSRNAQGFYARFGFLPTQTIDVTMPGGEAANISEMRLALSDQRAPRPTASPAPPFALRSATPQDFEAVLSIRIAAMKESLERLGRFSLERARQRLAASFTPEHGAFIAVGGQDAGFLTVKPQADHHKLEHLYLLPEAQGSGLGAAVLRGVIDRADAAKMPLHVGVLDQSQALRFYLQHGFVCESKEGVDWLLTRPVSSFQHP